MPNLRVLDFDLENRPLSYLGQDYTTTEITAIAACFVNEPHSMKVWLLGQDAPTTMLKQFRIMYDTADLVTGHYIRGHDLPIINGAMVELGLRPLDEQLTCDTKLDLIKKGPAFSASQENLSEMLGIAAPKVHMNTVKWREANRLTPGGINLTRARCVGDVVQHMALRKELLKRGLLNPPRQWRPHG